MLHPLFNEQQSLAHIDAKLRQLHQLHHIVCQALPKPLKAYCHSVYWSEKELVINIINSTAMSKIRLLCPGLLLTLRQQGVELNAIKLVMFFESHQPTTRPKIQRMTPAALAAFQQLTQTIQDPGLKKAIHRLLKAHQPKLSKHSPQ